MTGWQDDRIRRGSSSPPPSPAPWRGATRRGCRHGPPRWCTRRAWWASAAARGRRASLLSRTWGLQPPASATRGHSICLNLPYERGWCDCFCQLMMHCAGKHWSAHSCIMLTVRRGHTPRCSPYTHTSAHNSPAMIYQGSPHHLVLGTNTNIGFSLASDSPGLGSALVVDNWTWYLQLWFCSWYLGCRFNCVSIYHLQDCLPPWRNVSHLWIRLWSCSMVSE